MRPIIGMITVGIILILAGAAAAQEYQGPGPQGCADYEDYFHWTSRTGMDGQTRNIAVTGTHAYVAARTTGGLQVLDLADPAYPRQVGAVDLGGDTWTVAVAGNLASVWNGESGVNFFTVDVADPTAPAIVGTLETSGQNMGMAAVAGYVYRGTTPGIEVIDVTDPAAPHLLDIVPVPRGCGDLVVVGDHLFVGGETHLTVLDIVDPAAPVVVGEGSYGVTIRYPRLDVSDGHAAVGGYFNLVLIDVAVPTAPVCLGDFPVNTCDIAVRAPYVYAIENETYAIMAIDFSDPAAPVVRMNMEDHYIMLSLARGDDHLYAAAGELGVYAFAFADGPLVEPLEQVATPDLARGVDVASGFAYVADWRDAVQVIDLSAKNSTGAAIVATVPVSGRTRSVLATGRYLFVGDLDDGLHIADIKDPFSPAVVGFLPLERGADLVESAGDRLAVVSGSDLIFYDVGTPAAPAPVGTFTATSVIRGVKVRGDLAYLSEGGHLTVVDMADPAAAVQLSRVEMPTVSYDLDVVGTTAYVSCFWAGLVIVDVADPLVPVILTVQDTPNYARDVVVHGRFAYVADSGSGVQIVDVADPTQPVLVGRAGFMTRPGPVVDHHLSTAGAVVVADGQLLMTDDVGLQVLPLQCNDGSASVEVVIDIKPGSEQDPINCGAWGVIPVAIITTPEFDATDVDHRSVVFGPGEARESHANGHGVKRHETDVDDDGDLDLLFHFRVRDTGLDCTEEEVVLTGRTYDDRPIRGVSSFRPVPPPRPRAEVNLQPVAWPNPFNPVTTISFTLGAATAVDLRVYDIAGRLVRTLAAGETLPAGRRDVNWNGRDDHGRGVAAGVYLYRLQAGSRVETRRVMLIK